MSKVLIHRDEKPPNGTGDAYIEIFNICDVASAECAMSMSVDCFKLSNDQKRRDAHAAINAEPPNGASAAYLRSSAYATT